MKYIFLLASVIIFLSCSQSNQTEDTLNNKNDFLVKKTLSPEIQAKKNESNKWYEKGNDFSLSDKRKEAVEAFKKAIDLDPYNTSAYNGLGAQFMYLKKYNESLDTFNMVIQIYNNSKYADSNESITWELKGRLLIVLERYEEAVESFNEAIKLDPNDHIAIKQRNYILEKIEEIK